jgi:hypothetical protein
LPIAEKMVPCWQRSRDLCQQGKKMGDQWLSSIKFILQQKNEKFCIQLQ